MGGNVSVVLIVSFVDSTLSDPFDRAIGNIQVNRRQLVFPAFSNLVQHFFEPKGYVVQGGITFRKPPATTRTGHPPNQAETRASIYNADNRRTERQHRSTLSLVDIGWSSSPGGTGPGELP
jgi:hypothetical protein